MLHTAFTELFSVQHPIALAPMGGASGGALAAAVSNGGGLGLIGGGRQDPGWLDRELKIAAEGTGKPWGVGFQSWATDVLTVERALTYHPRAVMLSFGDPRALIEPIRRAGAALIVQVTDLEEARKAIDSELMSSWRKAPKPAGTAGGGPSGPSFRWWVAFPPPRPARPPRGCAPTRAV